MKKRFLSWLLVLTMVISLIPSTLVTTAFAANAAGGGVDISAATPLDDITSEIADGGVYTIGVTRTEALKVTATGPVTLVLDGVTIATATSPIELADGAQVTMTLEKTDRLARLTVSNPGDPIPPEQLHRLFERFYRADASRGEQSGFGLGLPIAAAIAAEHKGTLKAESDAASTRFIFTMPLLKK